MEATAFCEQSFRPVFKKKLCADFALLELLSGFCLY
jgi:hypothetical protein